VCALGLAACGRRERASDEVAFRFIDHLDEARVEGTLPAGPGTEALVYSDPLEVAAREAPTGFAPFAGFEPPADAPSDERAAWSVARDEVTAAIAPGPDERVAGSRGVALVRPSSGEFTGLRTGPIAVRPGALYRGEVWIRTDRLALPSPETGATLLAYGLALGRDAGPEADARLDERGFFSNHAIALDEVESGNATTGTAAWARESITVRTSQRVDHILLTLAMHGPQAPGERSGAVRFDDLRLFEIVPPVAALPPLAEHFTGHAHALKKKARLVEAPADSDEVTRNAILTPAPGRIAFETRIPEGGRLAFAYGVPQGAWADGGGVTFAIEVSARGGAQRVFEATLRPGVEPADRAWRTGHADLAAFGGRSATIAFVAAREGGGASAGLWGEPVLYRARDAERGSGGARKPAGSKAAPSILLVSIDTLRPDRLGCYGSPRRTSPEIDRFAASATLFETCVSASSWTLPAHVSMFTGVTPSLHRVTADERRLGASRVALAEILRNAGYATGAFVTHYYLTGDYGLDRGFESFTYRQDRPAAEVCARAASWLGANADRPFFLFLHLFDPHWNYNPPPGYAAAIAGADAPPYEGPVDGSLEAMQPWIEPRTEVPDVDRARALDLYDGEIAGVDAALGRLFAALDSLGLSERTLVVLTSDHGEEFRDHGSFGHGHTLYEETVRVPLIVRTPGASVGRRAPDAKGRALGARAGRGAGAEIRGDVAATIDIAPTILGWAGIAGPEGGTPRAARAAASDRATAADSVPAIWGPEGRDLFAAIAAPRDAGPSARDADRTIVSETERFGSWRFALRRGRLKYHTGGQYVWWRPFETGPELFDLQEDPGETHPRAIAHGDHSADAGLADAATWLALNRHRGILLVFRGSATGIDVVHGKITGPHLGAPTGVGTEAGDDLTEWADGIEFQITLNARDRDFVLLRGDRPGTARLEVAWNDEEPRAGLVVAGASRRHASLPFEIAPGAHLDPPDPARILAWDGPGLWILASDEEAGTDFSLDEEEIARLRALGYVH
jgi:arylsulfatase A-like enzyme